MAEAAKMVSPALNERPSKNEVKVETEDTLSQQRTRTQARSHTHTCRPAGCLFKKTASPTAFQQRHPYKFKKIGKNK